MIAALSTWEAGVLLWIQTVLRNGVTDPVVSVFTKLGDKGILFIALAVLLLLFPKTRRIGVAAAIALLCSLILTNLILKNLVGRVRPWVDFPRLIPLVLEKDPKSFPSGHSSAAFAFASAVFLTARYRWMKVTAAVLALLMALSRLYVGVHYPTDVLAGAAVGILAGALAAWLGRKLSDKFKVLS